MNTYFALFIIATFCAVTLTPLVRRLCERYAWLDLPGEARRVHARAVPRLGGVAIFLSVLLTLSVLALIDNLVTQSLRAERDQLWQTFIPATLVFLLGVYDDLRGADARVKFTALALGGALFYAMGGRIELLSLPLMGTVELPPVLSFPLTLVWMVGIANAFNLIDGIDGLAAGAALFASLVMLVVALLLGHPLVVVVACILCGALVGFLRYNFNPASIFLGDSGALFVGFVLAALSVNGAQKASTAVAVAIPLLAFGLPVVDTAFTLVRRFLGGRPLFEGDREHIHHMLLARGWSQRRVACVLYGACALFGMTALIFVSDTGRATGLLLFIIGATVVLAVGRLRYHEVDELKASMKRGLSERRLRAANHIGVRRAVRSMSEAATLEALFKALRELLDMGEFVYARVELGPVGDGAQKFDGSEPVINWAWERGDIEVSEIAASGRFWTMCLPLSTERGIWGHINLYRGLDADALLLDVNYLCHLFQRETAQAAERIFLSGEAGVRSADVLVLKAKV